MGITQYEEIRYRQTKGSLGISLRNDDHHYSTKKKSRHHVGLDDLFYREPTNLRLKQRKISENLKEFANVGSLRQYLYWVLFDSKSSQSVNDSNINIYRFV